MPSSMTRLSICTVAVMAGMANAFRARGKKNTVGVVASSREGNSPIFGFPGGIGGVLPNPDEIPGCHLSESDCLIDEMTEPTLVWTDSDTSVCWNGDKFAFLVVPGARDKLAFFLPGGGACYELPVISPGVVPTCFPTFRLGLAATGLGLGGIMKFSDDRNPFKDYTVVSPPYCSGGAHVANTTVQDLFSTRYSYGYNNNNFAMNWARKNLAPKLSNFVLMGSSAGSLGTAIWADYALSTLNYEKGTVIMDSYMGVFPDNTQGTVVKGFGACNLPLFRRHRAKCNAAEFNLQDFVDEVIGSYPKVAFATLQCKVDLVQRLFYKSVAASFFKPGDLYITERTFYQTTNEYMQRYNRHPNYVTYIVNGFFHTLLQWNFLYSASIKGELTAPPRGTPALVDWVNGLVNHDKVTSQCDGKRKRNGWYVVTGTRFCDEKLFPKTLAV